VDAAAWRPFSLEAPIAGGVLLLGTGDVCGSWVGGVTVVVPIGGTEDGSVAGDTGIAGETSVFALREGPIFPFILLLDETDPLSFRNMFAKGSDVWAYVIVVQRNKHVRKIIFFIFA
jgi:hypothetical protein